MQQMGHDIECKIDGFGAMKLKSSVLKKHSIVLNKLKNVPLKVHFLVYLIWHKV